MKLSTGKVGFPIEFDNGDKATIYFNPNDRGIRDRINGFEKAVEEKINNINLEKYKGRFETGKELKVDIDNPETLLEMSPEELKTLQDRLSAVSEIEDEYNNAVKEELDTVFGSKISDVAFKYCQPFDSVTIEDEKGNIKSELYIMHFLHWLMIELKKYGEKNSEAMKKHIDKYKK